MKQETDARFRGHERDGYLPSHGALMFARTMMSR
jgi:hypothetical protein